ncbi:FAD-dependent oxidoreductase [Chloroflexota bacterium]
MPQIKKLFEPVKLGNLELKNRVVMLGMTMGLGENYKINDKLINFLAARAKGGAGLVMLGSAFPTDLSNTKPVCHETPLGTGIWSDELIPGLKKLVQAIHDNGAKAGCQITLHYEWRANKGAPLEVVGPSDGPDIMAVGKVRALKAEEIHAVVAQFGDGVKRAHQAGFDVVEFNVGMGYFLNRFLSPFSNHREDEYGGSMENRMRMLLEIIADAKKKTADDYPIICRFSGDEFIEGGNTLEDVKKMIAIVEKAGVSAINLQAGWHESPRPLVQQWVPAGAYTYMAEEIKKVTSLPVMAAVRIDDPVQAEEILSQGKADLIGMARALLVDAELPNKAKEGKLGDIRRCILCCRCLDNTVAGLPPDCSVNAGLDVEELKPAAKSKKVLVIGSGPAGMEAARIAALRGHEVTLCEQGHRLGGLLVLASVLNDKLESLVRWMTGQITGLPIKVKLGNRVTSEMVQEMHPDVIIVAPGGQPVLPEIPGIDGDNVISGNDIKSMMNGIAPKKGILWGLGAFGAKRLSGKPGLMRSMMGFSFPIKKKVAIIGGQFAGLEIALTLMEKGKQVTVVEESKRLGSDIGIVTRWVELGMLRKGGVKLETLTKVKEITGKGLKVVREDGKEEFIEADTVMPALGVTENKSLSDQIKGKDTTVYLIGDAAGGDGIRRIREAIADGYEVGSKI